MINTLPRISNTLIEQFAQDGFVHVPNVLEAGEVTRFHDAALRAAEKLTSLSDRPVFTQLVNVWQDDADMRDLTLHPNVAAIATALAGVPLRLWHDQILIKKPHNNAATEFHQDQPYWPHLESTHPISAWIALCDVPVEKGCMTFLPGSQKRTDLPAQNLGSATSLFEICPELMWERRVTVPLKAGDCTFHHGRCAHMATPNFTDDPRVAHVIIYMDRGTKFSGSGHVVTDPLGLSAGNPLNGDLFPELG